MVSARFRRLAVADVRRETADCVSIAFAVPPRAAPVFRFQPGQYLTLRARFGGKELRRCYSICDDRELRIAVKRVPGGVFSTWATEALAPGDAVEVLPPAGGFTLALDPAARRVVVALACGSGITPVMALLKSVLAGEPGSRFHLIYGNRTSRDIIFAEELARLKDRHLDRLSVTHVLSREAQDVPILAGRLDAARIAALLPAGRIDEALLCGPVAMMDAAAAVLAGRGVAAAHIRREVFAVGAPVLRPAPPPPAAPAAAAIAAIVIDGRRHEIAVPPGMAVIEAALAAGLALPYSCRAGMCCTCRARLVEGRVEMAANYSLQPWELDAGFVLTCQSRPLTPRLTLDYDAV